MQAESQCSQGVGPSRTLDISQAWPHRLYGWEGFRCGLVEVYTGATWDNHGGTWPRSATGLERASGPPGSAPELASEGAWHRKASWHPLFHLRVHAPGESND